MPVNRVVQVLKQIRTLLGYQMVCLHDVYNFTGIMEYGNVGMTGKTDCWYGRVARCATGAEACAAPKSIFFQYSAVPLFLSEVTPSFIPRAVHPGSA
jgi:hypothetical protein